MLARCKELIPLVDGGDVRSVHDGVFFHQAQPAAVGGGVEDGVGGQRLYRVRYTSTSFKTGSWHIVSPDVA